MLQQQQQHNKGYQHTHVNIITSIRKHIILHTHIHTTKVLSDTKSLNGQQQQRHQHGGWTTATIRERTKESDDNQGNNNYENYYQMFAKNKQSPMTM